MKFISLILGVCSVILTSIATPIVEVDGLSARKSPPGEVHCCSPTWRPEWKPARLLAFQYVDYDDPKSLSYEGKPPPMRELEPGTCMSSWSFDHPSSQKENGCWDESILEFCNDNPYKILVSKSDVYQFLRQIKLECEITHDMYCGQVFNFNRFNVAFRACEGTSGDPDDDTPTPGDSNDTPDPSPLVTSSRLYTAKPTGIPHPIVSAGIPEPPATTRVVTKPTGVIIIKRDPLKKEDTLGKRVTAGTHCCDSQWRPEWEHGFTNQFDSDLKSITKWSELSPGCQHVSSCDYGTITELCNDNPEMIKVDGATLKGYMEEIKNKCSTTGNGKRNTVCGQHIDSDGVNVIMRGCMIGTELPVRDEKTIEQVEGPVDKTKEEDNESKKDKVHCCGPNWRPEWRGVDRATFRKSLSFWPLTKDKEAGELTLSIPPGCITGGGVLEFCNDNHEIIKPTHGYLQGLVGDIVENCRTGTPGKNQATESETICGQRFDPGGFNVVVRDLSPHEKREANLVGAEDINVIVKEKEKRDNNKERPQDIDLHCCNPTWRPEWQGADLKWLHITMDLIRRWATGEKDKAPKVQMTPGCIKLAGVVELCNDGDEPVAVSSDSIIGYLEEMEYHCGTGKLGFWNALKAHTVCGQRFFPGNPRLNVVVRDRTAMKKREVHTIGARDVSSATAGIDNNLVVRKDKPPEIHCCGPNWRPEWLGADKEKLQGGLEEFRKNHANGRTLDKDPGCGYFGRVIELCNDAAQPVSINGTVLYNTLKAIEARCTSGGPGICSEDKVVRVCGQVTYPGGINMMIRDVGKSKRAVEIAGAEDVSMSTVDMENSLALREEDEEDLHCCSCDYRPDWYQEAMSKKLTKALDFTKAVTLFNQFFPADDSIVPFFPPGSQYPIPCEEGEGVIELVNETEEIITIEKQVVQRYLHRVYEDCGGRGANPLRARENPENMFNHYAPYAPPTKLNRPCGQNLNYGGWSVVLRACDVDGPLDRRSNILENPIISLEGPSSEPTDIILAPREVDVDYRSDWKEQMGPGLYFDDAFAEFNALLLADDTTATIYPGCAKFPIDCKSGQIEVCNDTHDIINVEKHVIMNYLQSVHHECGDGYAHTATWDVKIPREAHNWEFSDWGPQEVPAGGYQTCGQRFNYGGWNVVMRGCDKK
ncbi:hypothetical protein GLAREA_12003 [Glarea lozoyensis ATCC 20868]|uniref:Uncharacterized protein n=1 Tax=Glarea lozoyensis (strain ATCC 20868 / MF5171) TaxID=1116229 RepID=S3DIR4_GLAL2|nr:uncharacterized protein GLAREA_12003 [Glarea lozoyensis ATCC 20868]EPE31921.1 hypothetical protein GLAREA_12003 [Glarea lozoyensis ATCC 20868]